jgi:endogenous inhibitor of DNA gyrase (YacG/DUF329 family)
VNQNGAGGLQINFSGIGCWLTLIVGAWLLGAVGLGWLIKSALVLIALILLTPILAFAGFRFWLRRNLIEGNCPVCSQPLTGIAPLQVPCPNCGTLIKATRAGFTRVTPEGTIDIQAVDVDATAVDLTDDQESTLPVIDVTARQLPEAD